MKRSALSFFDARRVFHSSMFMFAVAILLCGMVAGSFTGMHIPQNDKAYMNRLSELLTRDYTMYSIRQSVATAGCIAAWPVGVLIVSCGQGRELWTALILAARGFLFSFSVTAAVVEYGWRGVCLSAIATGIPATASLPALALISAAALLAGQRAGRRSYGTELRQYGGALTLGVLLLLAAVVWRLAATPLLFSIIPWNL